MIPLNQAGCNIFTKTFYLAFVAWREARSAKLPDGARLGVMFTLLNRTDHPGWWGKSIDDCATKRLQYSSLTDPRDKQLTTWFLASDASWFRCVELARQVLAGEAVNPVRGADSYFDDSIEPPAWTKTARFCGQIGTLKFYDVDHDFEAQPLVASGAIEPDFDAKLRAFLEG